MKRKWIPVDEQLPAVGRRVLTFVPCHNHEHPHTVGAFMFNGHWAFDAQYEDAVSPTYWMPLPEDPPAA
jgi:hypothetical protein